MAEYVWIKLCWVISFINLHKNLIKKLVLILIPRRQKNKQLFTFISGAVQWSFSLFIVLFF